MFNRNAGKTFLAAAFALFITSPALADATTDSMRSQLFRAICSEQWNEANSLALTLSGSDQVTPAERSYYLAIRQPMAAYQRGDAQFAGCVNGMPISSGEAPTRSGSGLNWQGVASVVNSSGSGASTQAAAPSRPAVSITEWSFDSEGWLVGRVRNNTGGAVRSVQIEYEILRNGRLIDSGSFLTEDTTLEPGESTTFSYPPRGGDEGDEARVTATWIPAG